MVTRERTASGEQKIARDDLGVPQKVEAATEASSFSTGCGEHAPTQTQTPTAVLGTTVRSGNSQVANKP